MSRSILGALVLSFLFASAAHAAPKGWGIGFIAGEPTGLVIKKWMNSKNAMDAAVAWSSTRGGDKVEFHMDYLTHNYTMFRSMKRRMPIYFGIGARANWADINAGIMNADLAVRVPIGLNYLFSGNKFDFFIEAVPTLNVSGATNLEVNGAIGVRYYFK